jgi:hypothetical protein
MKAKVKGLGTVGGETGSFRAGRVQEVLCFQCASGATRRDRTGDLLITNQPLYQLS